jgi:hypothetical protein
VGLEAEDIEENLEVTAGSGCMDWVIGMVGFMNGDEA